MGDGFANLSQGCFIWDSFTKHHMGVWGCFVKERFLFRKGELMKHCLGVFNFGVFGFRTHI